MNVIEVVDVPPGTSEADARELFNRPCTENTYMLVQVLQMADGTQRAIYRLLARALDTKPETQPEGREEEALAIIRAHPRDSLTHLMARLKAAGITRGHSWVSCKRTMIAIERGDVKLAK
jgi:hypothetical protein